MNGPKPPKTFVSNGCNFAFDGWWFEACRYHDWAYRKGVMDSRYQADLYFLNNLLLLKCPILLALIYWFLVRLFGWRYWHVR